MPSTVEGGYSLSPLRSTGRCGSQRAVSGDDTRPRMHLHVPLPMLHAFAEQAPSGHCSAPPRVLNLQFSDGRGGAERDAPRVDGRAHSRREGHARRGQSTEDEEDARHGRSGDCCLGKLEPPFMDKVWMESFPTTKNHRRCVYMYETGHPLTELCEFLRGRAFYPRCAAPRSLLRETCARAS